MYICIKWLFAKAQVDAFWGRYIIDSGPPASQRLEVLCLRAPPTHQVGKTLPRGAARVHSGQRPISLEYQIHPPAIDTPVTGMGGEHEKLRFDILREGARLIAVEDSVCLRQH